MSKQSERLFEAISHLNDEILDPALEPRKKEKKGRWVGWAALAACFCLVVGVVTGRIPLLGGRSSQPVSGADGAITFQSYAGPVLPMTLREENETITAQRAITLDFAPWIPVWDEELELERYDDHILVTDAYTLTNHGETDQNITLLYPFVTSLHSLELPVLTVDGSEVETDLYLGSYAGAFEGGGGLLEGEEGGSINLDSPESWEGYQTLLSDGSYLARALGTAPDVSGISVTVYQFTDPYAPEDRGETSNPTIRAAFDLDYNKTRVLTYGFHACRYDPESGAMVQGFSIPEERESNYGEPFYLLVIGEDIKNLTVGGYVTGGVDEDTPQLEGCGVTVERYESDLDTMLREVLTRMTNGRETQVDFELYYRVVLEQLLAYGGLTAQEKSRYSSGWLEDVASDAEGIQRVCWLEAQVTVPAGGSLTVTASMEKEASYDYSCDRANQGTRGYDLVTTLGSNLTCTEQTATLEDRGQIEILQQNFGFDLDAGIKTVELDAETEHYFLTVRRADS